MRYVKIFLLNMQYVFEIKSKTFVYFLLSLTGPFMFLLFWLGARITKNVTFNVSSIISYYFLLVIVSSLLMVHMENDIGIEDIQEGGLVKYLLKPISYFWSKFLGEIPYRLLQAGMSVIVFIFLLIFFGNFFSITKSPLTFFLSLVIASLGLFISYTYKVILGLIAFWVEDINGIFQLSEILIYIFAGFIVPVYVFPKALEVIAYMLPFSYMIYFPIAAVQGRLTMLQDILVIFVQLVWLFFFFLLYSITWKKGRQKFLGVGQ